MKIKLLSLAEDRVEKRDYRNAFEIHVGESLKLRFWDGEPEDANLCRDFNDVYRIEDALKMAYEAGRNSESYEVEFGELEG